MSNDPYFDHLSTAIRQRAGDTAPARNERFARLFWQQATDEDLVGRSVEDDAALCIESYRLFEQRSAEQVVIRIANPVKSRDGWQSRHTVVSVMAQNMPFAVDSVLMALSHDGIVTHFLNNVVFAVDRAGDRRIENISHDNEHGNRELFIYAEIDRLPDAQLPELESRLQLTVKDLIAAVEDFLPMKEKLAEIRDDIAFLTQLPAVEVTEAGEFLDWLARDNFTFLGFREFDYRDDKITQVGESLGVNRNRKPASVRAISEQTPSTREFLLEQHVLSFSKGGRKSLVHRPTYPDYIGIKKFDESGAVIGEYGFLGLYTSQVYTDHPSTIPVVRLKLEHVVQHAEFDPAGFDGKVLKQVLATYPRDELFQISQEELFQQAVRVTHFHERRLTRLFLREGRYGLFVTCLVYLPRDMFDTRIRKGIEAVLVEAVGAEDTQYDIHLSESILVRLQFVLRVDPLVERTFDVDALERNIAGIVNDWESEFKTGLVDEFGEVEARNILNEYADAFTAGYRETYSAAVAVADIACILAMEDGRTINTRLYRHVEDDVHTVRLKAFHRGEPLPLSEQIPKLEHLGFNVQYERSFLIQGDAQQVLWVHDFKLTFPALLDLRIVSDLFNDSFAAIWLGVAEDDRLNRLILGAELNWRQVGVLRAYSRYLKQIRFGLSQEFIGNTLCEHRTLARLLITFFNARLAPDAKDDAATVKAEILSALDQVTLLNEDRVLRQICELIAATLRTNFFQLDSDGVPKHYLSLKLDPTQVPYLPQPRPRFEIFVSAATFEGVHLRAGAIARGGLRWSDRQEDYRTEVLGLMKAQVVKNGVIVPTGAKGGFVIRPRNGELPDPVECYKSFISGLLDLTDNRIDGQLQPPPETQCHDEPDPYLVVAADKGTATFSDHANDVSAQYGFWLGDAFASGGSNGYDHKKMAITARGAWVSVQRHFAEVGVDVQADSITVIGIGDMAGDVFGNGMLRSQTLQLVAAFNHRHIFIDPTPDAAIAFAERQRLFELPQSSWADYDESKISAGGGIFSRDLKAVPITPQIRETFNIEEEQLAPDELIHLLLKAKVDLLWNGGIGTYVKSRDESHDDVGDRANDHIRIDADELRARVVGEGGNLGFTQRARIEYAERGGAINTDSIDNSAGVNCSDREVNIKILLDRIVSDGDMTPKQRNQVLVSLTDDVAQIVLKDNLSQTRALSLARAPATDQNANYLRFMTQMESSVGLDRTLEHLPTDQELTARVAAGGGLTRPELAVLLAYAKIHIKNALVATDILEEPIALEAALRAFPTRLQGDYRGAVLEHSLKREIVASQLANTLVDGMGITFTTHLMDVIGTGVDAVVKAYLVFAHLFGISDWIDTVDALPNVNSATKQGMLLELTRLGSLATRWLLRHKRSLGNLSEYIEMHQPAVAELVKHRQDAMIQSHASDWRRSVRKLAEAGVPQQIAETTAAASRLADVLPILEIANDYHVAPMEIALEFVELSERLHIDALVEAIAALSTNNHWQIMEQDALTDTVKTLQADLASQAMATTDGNIAHWFDAHPMLLTQWHAVISDAFASPEQDLSMYAMICRRLQDIAGTIRQD